MKKIILFTFLILFAGRAFTQSGLDNEKLVDLMQNQRYKEAAGYVGSFFLNGFSDDKMLARLGYLNYLSGNLAEAELNYLTLLKKDSLNRSYLTTLANINYKRTNYAKALFHYQKILKLDSLNFNVYKQLAELGQYTGDTNRVKYLAKANSINPQDGDVAFDLSDIYIKEKKFLQADTVLNMAIQADSSNLLLYRSKGQLAYSINKWRDVITVCEKLTSEGDSASLVLYWLNEAYYQTKQYQKCIAIGKILENHENEKESSLYFTAQSYKALNDNIHAIECFKRLLYFLVPKYMEDYYLELAGSYASINQPKTAIVNYQKSIDLLNILPKKKERNPLTNYLIAQIYDTKLHDTAQALKHYKRFLSVLNPQEVKALKIYTDYVQERVTNLSSIAKKNRL